MAKFQYDDIYEGKPLPLQFAEGASTDTPIDDDTALSWVKFFHESVLKNNEEHTNTAIGIDPFYKAADSKYLLYLADDGTLKELVSEKQQLVCVDDPEFCRQTIKLSQQGRLFVRTPGKNSCRQVMTTKDNFGPWHICMTNSTEKLSLKQPVYPQAPAFWKYLLYPFFAGQIRKYNEDRKAFENEYGTQIAGKKAYVENLQKSLQQLDAMEGLDEQALMREIEQKEAVRTAWEQEMNLKNNTSHSISDRMVKQHVEERRAENQEIMPYEPIQALKFNSDLHLMQVASLNTTMTSPDYNYMDELKRVTTLDITDKFRQKREGVQQLSINGLGAQMAQSRKIECLENNMHEINKCSAKDPEFRLLMAMNEALLENLRNEKDPYYRDARKTKIEGLYNRQVELRSVVEAFHQMFLSKKDALKDYVEYNSFDDSRKQKFRRDFAAAVLLEILDTNDNLHKVKGSAEPNPLFQMNIGEDHSYICGCIVASDTFWKMIQQTTADEKLEILNNREKMLELMEKVVAEPNFKEKVGNLHLDEILKEAKSVGLYGPQAVVDDADAKKFEDYLNKVTGVDTTVDSVEMLKTEGTTYDSYCGYLTQVLENQIAKPMLDKINKMDPQVKTAFLLYNKPRYENLVSGIRKFVAKEVDSKLIQDYINGNLENDNTPVEKIEKSIRKVSMDIQNNGLKRYKNSLAQDVPQEEKTTVQIEKGQQEIQADLSVIAK